MILNNHYNKNLKEFARELRTNSISRAEKIIWRKVLSKRQTGVKFLRQRPINNFIVDFFSPEIKLIIEIDGVSHLNKGTYDKFREEKLMSLGYDLIRFQEGDVIQNIGNVIEKIEHTIYCLKNSEIG